MGTKNKPGDFDCYNNALPDEPMFILLARDPWAPDIVETWAASRLRDIIFGRRPESDRAMVEEARECAESMRKWRAANAGRWRAEGRPRPEAAEPGAVSETETLGDALPKAMARVRDELMPIYQSVGPAGAFALALMRAELDRAAAALAQGDLPAMIRSYRALQEFKE